LCKNKLKGAAPIGKFFVKAKTNNQKGATPMQSKLKPSQQKSKLIDQIISNKAYGGFEDFVTASVEHVLQEALEGEVTDHLGRQWYQPQKTEHKSKAGYRNGYYPRSAKTSEGRLHFQVPRVRDSEEPFESEILKRLDSLEDRIKDLATEMYVRGLSTRDIEATFNYERDKPLLSRNQVSEITDSLYAEYESFQQRDLSGYDVVYLFVDGVYEAVRRYTRNQAILVAWGVCSNGEKVLLHMSAAGEENEAAWALMFNEMLDRGLRQPLLVTSDGHKGLVKAITRSFPRAKRQRCLAHKMRNLISKVPMDVQKEIKAHAHTIYYANEQSSAETLASMFIERYAEKYPAMIKCFQEDYEACLIQLEFPLGHRRIIRTTNLIERSFVEEKRRTKIIPQHQNEKGAMKLVFGVLLRASQNWQRITMKELDLVMLRNIRQTIVPEIELEEKLSYEWAA
jgi:putative transposase